MAEQDTDASHILMRDGWSAGRSRRIVAQAMADAGCQIPTDTALLLASELVTNAVKYGGAPITLDLHVSRNSVIVGVSDAGAALPRLPAASARLSAQASESLPVSGLDDRIAHLPNGGRGMWLVSGLADRWGVEHLDTGKRVWFELRSQGRE